MFTARKRHLRKKRFFLSKQKTFVLFNGSNLKTSKLTDISLSLSNAKLYSVPLYLKPPKIAKGYPLIMVIYDKIEDLQYSVTKLVSTVDCLGVSIDDKWYPLSLFKKENVTNLNKKFLALLLLDVEKRNSSSNK